MFIKYRINEASGKGHWNYADVLDILCFESLMVEQWGSSSTFRGIETKKIKKPPDSWLRNQIIVADFEIDRLEHKVNEYTKLICRGK